ncbi:MAG: hypothetical protein Q8R16_02720 [bacterium]|nr:hypothetical protein [bacterium]
MPRGVILERFWVSQGGAEGVEVQRNGKLALDLYYGPITVDLDDRNVTNVHVR